MENISVKPDTIRLFNLLEEIKQGNISIPIFQRDFVWEKEQMKDLFDSISKGFPIGSFLFWRPGKDYKIMTKIGPYLSPQSKKKYYVLDGFQRIATLYGALTNPKDFHKTENDDNIKDFLIYYNLETKDFNFLKYREQLPLNCILLYKIADTFEYLDFIQEIRGSSTMTKEQQIKLINNAREINKAFLDYYIPYVEITGGDMESAVTIFSRVNSKGIEISKDFMLSALSYNDETDFLLSESITAFLNELTPYNFADLKRDTILNCIATAQGKIYFDVAIEDLKNIETFAKSAYVHIKKAVEFLYTRIGMLNVRLLPYQSQLIFISEYYRLNPTPNKEDLKKLEDWFWITTYSNYFTMYPPSQQRSAYQALLLFASNKHENGVFKSNSQIQLTTYVYPNKLNFTGVRPKALQLFYLRSISPKKIQLNEGHKEFFIDPTSKRDRSPANILIRLISEFEADIDKKMPDSFIKNSSFTVLKQHFITKEMLDLYKQGKIEDFLQKREDYMKEKEKAFVEQWDIKYIV